MKDKKHPLDDTFNVGKEDVLNYDEKIDIPEIRNLDTIIELALTAYKEQMEIVDLVEPKNKIKYMEVAERYLGQAKDAMYKKEYLLQNQQKIDSTNARKKPDPNKGEQVLTEEGEQEEIPREELFKLINGGKK